MPLSQPAKGELAGCQHTARLDKPLVMRELLETRAIRPRRNVSPHSTRPWLLTGQIPKLKLQKAPPRAPGRGQNIWCLSSKAGMGAVFRRGKVKGHRQWRCAVAHAEVSETLPLMGVLVTSFQPYEQTQGLQLPLIFFFFATSCFISLPYCQLASVTSLSTSNTKIWVV